MAEILRVSNHESIKDQFFFHAHPEAWKALSPHVHAKSYAKDSALFYHGDPAHSVWLVTQGWVKLTRQTPDGKETIIGLCTAGDVFGEAGLFANASYPYNAEAIAADTELATIPSDVIRNYMKDNAALSNSILSLLNSRVTQTQLQLEHMSTMSTSQRLGCFFLHLCERKQEKSQTLHIPVEKYLLASYLGMKPETLSRSQAQLREEGIEVHGTEVRISDVHRLREFVCNSCSESGACQSEGE